MGLLALKSSVLFTEKSASVSDTFFRVGNTVITQTTPSDLS